MNAIEIKDLCKSYKDFSLDKLNLTLPGGSIKLLGRDNLTDIKSLKEDIGVMLYDVGIPGCLNAKQVGKIMALTFRNWKAGVYADYLGRLDIPENKRFGDFSRGMKMKLGIAVALSHEAKLLLLDEPTTSTHFLSYCIMCILTRRWGYMTVI